MLGGRGSEGDINFWGNTLRPHPLTGSVRIADGAGGVGAATHDLAEIESYLRGQVHIFIDDAPPNNALRGPGNRLLQAPYAPGKPYFGRRY